jgi:glutaredoxin-like protein NrdH
MELGPFHPPPTIATVIRCDASLLERNTSFKRVQNNLLRLWHRGAMMELERVIGMLAFTKVDGTRDIGDIRIFALSTCGWCKKTKAFFTSRDIRYSYIDVDLLGPEEMAQAKEAQRKFNPRGSFPTIVFDELETVVGYDEEKLLEMCGEN